MESKNLLNYSALGGFTYSLTVIVFLFLNLVASFIMVAIPEGSQVRIYFGYLVAPIALCISCVGLIKVKKLSFKKMLPCRCSFHYYLIGLMLIFGLLFFLGDVNGYFLKFLEGLGYQSSQSKLPNLEGWNILPAIFVIALLPAIFEECIFRGVLLQTTKEGVGGLPAIFIVGFCFSLFHASPEQTIYQMICGCYFAWITLKAESILPAIVMHFINNFLIILFTSLGLVGSDGMLIISTSGKLIIEILSALSLIGATVWLVFDRKKLNVGDKKGIAQFFIFASVGILIMAIFWISKLFGV